MPTPTSPAGFAPVQDPRPGVAPVGQAQHRAGRSGDDAGRSSPRWPFAVLVTVVVASVITRVGPGAALLVGFVVAVPVERIWRRHDVGVRRRGLRTDAFHFLFTGALQTASLVVAVAICMVPWWPLLDNPVAQAFQGLPGAVQAMLGLVAFELFGYWYHRLCHEWSFLWRFHAVHHSSERLDWIAAVRLHPLEGFFAGLVVGPPLLLVGVRPTTFGLLGLVTQLWAVTLHMNVRWRLRALDGIWGTTEYHHWHHSNDPAARNRNYSGLLPVLDIVFGTYFMPKDRRPQVYGIDDPMPDGYLAQLAHPFRRRPRSAPPAPPAPVRGLPVGPVGASPPTPVPSAPTPPAPVTTSGWVPPGSPTEAADRGWHPEPWARL